MPPKKPLPKQRKGKGLGSPRSGQDGDGSDHTSDDENASTSANLLPSKPVPTINPLILHGAEEVLQLADNIADTEDFCHRLVEDLVEMVQDCMIASHVDRIAVPWTVQDIIGQLYAGMHFCIAERDCAASSTVGPQLYPDEDQADHTHSGGHIVEDRTRQYYDDSIEEPLGAQQVLSIPHTPMTEDLSLYRTANGRLASNNGAYHQDPSGPVRRNASRLPLFHKANVGHGGIIESSEHHGGGSRWVDYNAQIDEPGHIPADSWSRGVIAVRKRLFINGSNVINASALSATSRPATGVDSALSTSIATANRRRPSTGLGGTSVAGRVSSSSKIMSKRPVSSTSGGSGPEGDGPTRPSTGKQLSGAKIARATSNVGSFASFNAASAASGTPPPSRKVRPVTGSATTSATTTPPPISLGDAEGGSTTLELLQRGDEGLKEEDKKIMAQDRHAREQMAKLKASSAELSRQLGELKSQTNFIVDARVGKVIPQARTDKLEPIDGSISYAQSIANAPSPPPSHINSGMIGGTVPIKISTEGGTYDDAAEAAAAAALEAANITGVSSIGGRNSPNRPVSPSASGKPKMPKSRKLPPSAYFSVETRIANPMIPTQVVPAGGVSSKEGDSIMTAELPQPPVIAGVRPMSRQDFLKVQKENGLTPQTMGGNGSSVLGLDESQGMSVKQSQPPVASAALERPQSTPPDIAAAAASMGNSQNKRSQQLSQDQKKDSDGPSSSLLKRFGNITQHGGREGNASGNDTASFHNYRNTGNSSLPPRPSSTHQPITSKVRKDVFIPNASKLSLQGDTGNAAQPTPLASTLPARSGTPSAALMPVRKHFKPLFDERGNVRPATAQDVAGGSHGDSAAATGALKYVLSQKGRAARGGGGSISRPQSGMGLSGFEAIDATGNGGDLLDGNSRPISRGPW